MDEAECEWTVGNGEGLGVVGGGVMVGSAGNPGGGLGKMET